MSVACCLVAAWVVALPRPSPARLRLATLSATGRLAGPSSRVPVGRRRLPRWPLPVAATAVSTVLGLPPAAALALGVLVAAGLWHWTRTRSARANSAVTRDALGAVRLVRAELAAGSEESAALAAAASVSGSLSPLLARSARAAAAGDDVASVLAGPASGDGSALGTALARAWRVRADCGAALGEVVGIVEDDLVATADRTRAVTAALAGPRSSALVLAGLPVVGIALGIGLGAHPLRFLFDSPVGSLVLLAGVGLDVLGVAWTDRLTRSAPGP